MHKLFPTCNVQELRNHLGSFGIRGKLADQPMALCSGGQKSRISFAAITFARPHILVLDEPTNHLDPESIQALTTSLKSFEGGLIVVSHNRTFLSDVVQEFYEVKDGHVTPFAGTVDDYSAQVQKQALKCLSRLKL
jgi:ATP-binding cassette subfamily F protein 3